MDFTSQIVPEKIHVAFHALWWNLHSIKGISQVSSVEQLKKSFVEFSWTCWKDYHSASYPSESAEKLFESAFHNLQGVPCIPNKLKCEIEQQGELLRKIRLFNVHEVEKEFKRFNRETIICTLEIQNGNVSSRLCLNGFFLGFLTK